MRVVGSVARDNWDGAPCLSLSRLVPDLTAPADVAALYRAVGPRTRAACYVCRAILDAVRRSGAITAAATMQSVRGEGFSVRAGG
jgi:hypothetical protein